MTREDVILSLVRSGELEIDQEGQIWRLAKRGGNPNRNFAVRPCPRVRAEYSQRDGYLLVTTMIAGKKTTASAHRVVWTHFRGAIPPGITINHKDGNKANNRPKNLELATYSEQRRHAIHVLGVRKHQPKGSSNPKTCLLETDVLTMRSLRRSGARVKEIAEQYGMDPRAVSAITTGKTWKHV
jgi:HNH endonuclease